MVWDLHVREETTVSNASLKLNSHEIHFSQKTLSFNKIDRATSVAYTYDDLVQSMRTNGWKGDPIDVVRMPDRKLTSMDNTRIIAAREAIAFSSKINDKVPHA